MSFLGRDSLLDVVKGSVTTLALFLAFITIPVAGLFPGIFTPLPAIYYSLKRGQTTGAAIVAICAAVLGVMDGGVTTAVYLLQGGVLATVLPYFLNEGKGAARSLAYAVAVNLALILLLAVAYGAVRGVNIDRQILKGIEASITQTASLYEKAGVKGEELAALKEGLTAAGHQMGKVYPAMMIIGIVGVAGLNMLALVRLSSRLPRWPSIGAFRDFKNPEPLVWLLIVAGFALLVPDASVARIALNVLIVTVFMYFIQGLAVVIHYFARASTPQFLKVMFYILLLIQPYLAIGLALVGIFDIWGNFRTPKPQNL